MFEKVSSKHPDKVCDCIGGAILDLQNKKNKNFIAAIECTIGHGKCLIINETNTHIAKRDVNKIVKRIAPEIKDIEYIEVKQDKHLAKNQSKEIRCGDNGIFVGTPITKEQKTLTSIAKSLYKKFPTDGKYILNEKDKTLIICQSCAKDMDIRKALKSLEKKYKIIVNPLGEWTGGSNTDTGCIEENELVLTKDGFKRIKDVKSGDLVQTKNGLKQVIKNIYKGEKETVTIIDKRNHEVSLTPDHKVLTFNNNKFEFKEADKLTKGDLLVKNNEDVLFNKHHNKCTFYVGRGEDRKKCILDTYYPKHAYLLGYLVGDGWYNEENNLVQFSCCGEEEYNSVFKHIVDSFDFKPQVYSNKVFNKKLNKFILDRKITICSQTLCNALKKLGFSKGAQNKSIPDCILKAPKNIQAAFISGLFDSDGSCRISKSGRNCGLETIEICFSSVSSRLIKDVSSVLNNLNIQTSISKIKNRITNLCKNALIAYRLSIPGEKSKKEFMKLIGFALPRKCKCLSPEQLDKRTRDFEFEEMRNYPCYSVAPLINKDIYLKYRYALEKYSDLSSKKMNRFISYQKLTFVLDIYGKYKDTKEYKFVESLLKYNIIPFKEIKKVGIRKVYDLQINEEHNFTANEFIVHNCANRKLGSDMGDAVTGGGINLKDTSKADVSVNIYCHLLAQHTGKKVKAYCAIGDDRVKVNGHYVAFKDIVKVARKYIKEVGGYEEFSKWGLIR